MTDLWFWDCWTSRFQALLVDSFGIPQFINPILLHLQSAHAAGAPPFRVAGKGRFKGVTFRPTTVQCYPLENPPCSPWRFQKDTIVRTYEGENVVNTTELTRFLGLLTLRTSPPIGGIIREISHIDIFFGYETVTITVGIFSPSENTEKQKGFVYGNHSS